MIGIGENVVTENLHAPIAVRGLPMEMFGRHLPYCPEDRREDLIEGGKKLRISDPLPCALGKVKQLGQSLLIKTQNDFVPKHSDRDISYPEHLQLRAGRRIIFDVP
jgi:hypothetical protein